MVSTINQLPFDPKAVNRNPLPPDFTQAGRKSATTTATMDAVTFTQSTDSAVTYTKPVMVDGMVEKGYEMLRKLVTSMLEEQGIDYKISMGPATVDISTISQEEAAELIADDGYFGVEQTSDRIVNFAIAIAGGDVSKLEAIKEGVETGFNEALEIFGGSLPDISYNTLDAIMEKLDAWAAEADSIKA